MSITICDTHLVRTVRYLSLTFEPVYFCIGLFLPQNERNVNTMKKLHLSLTL